MSPGNGPTGREGKPAGKPGSEVGGSPAVGREVERLGKLVGGEELAEHRLPSTFGDSIDGTWSCDSGE